MGKFMNRLLASTVFYYFAQVLVTFMFWGAGLDKLINYQNALGEMTHFNLTPAPFFAIGSAIILLLGSLIQIFGKRYAWLGAGMLILFTAATIPIAHHFWNMTGEQKITEMHVALEHITVIGGLVIAAIAAELKFGPRR